MSKTWGMTIRIYSCQVSRILLGTPAFQACLQRFSKSGKISSILGCVELNNEEFIEGYQGWHQEFSDGGLTVPMRGLKYGFQGTINAKNLRKIAFHLPTKAIAP